MSTKIYYACRVRIPQLNRLIDFMRDQMFRLAADMFSRSYGLELGEDQKTAFNRAFDQLASTPEEFRNIDLECGLNVWIHGHYSYIIPIATKAILREIHWPEFAEDYSYWNNTEEPDGVTRSQWANRGKTWGRINCGEGISDHNARRMYHAVVEFQGNDWGVRRELAMRMNIVGYGE